jgi:hypothetical protein
MSHSLQFVNDGRERHLAEIVPAIEAEVRAEFAERLAKASRLQKWRLRAKIRREIRRRIAAAASDRALF